MNITNDQTLVDKISELENQILTLKEKLAEAEQARDTERLLANEWLGQKVDAEVRVSILRAAVASAVAVLQRAGATLQENKTP